jgi:hypothetical protein
VTPTQKRLADAVRRLYPNAKLVTIPWRKSQDVPRFLRKLDAFERRSRKSNLVVGALRRTTAP